MKGPTRVNHPPDAAVPADNHPLVAPIYQSVKFAFESLEEALRFNRGEREGYFYTRRANPTTRQLEKLLAELQGRDDCVVVGSGIASVTACFLTQLKAGDHLLCFVETYGPSLQLIKGLLARFGVSHTMLSIEDDTGIERALAERPTKLVYFESPTNPITRIADIARITKMAQAHGALTALDNTFAGFHNHSQYGIDLYLHSLTKYASGHGDVMAGAIIGRAELIRPIRRECVLLGTLLDPHAAFLVMRGMKTYYLRYEAQAANAMCIAQFLDAHPAVARVHYPGLTTHPRHALACSRATPMAPSSAPVIDFVATRCSSRTATSSTTTTLPGRTMLLVRAVLCRRARRRCAIASPRRATCAVSAPARSTASTARRSNSHVRSACTSRRAD